MAEVVRSKEEVRRRVVEARAAGKSIGFVPTMGALHIGHRELIERSAAENGYTVLSIFVNPTQFGPAEDLDRYPRRLEADVALAAEGGADLVFAPAVGGMYASGHSTWVEEARLSEGLCGARRPGHFRGVATVCVKLFNIVRPDRAYFGCKDYQQLKVVQRMVRDLDFTIEICPVETVRDPDGLATSSRNQYLDPEERRAALAIPRALKSGADLIRGGERSPRIVAEAVRSEIVREGRLQMQYVEVVDAETLEIVAPLGGRIVIAVAAYSGQTRLIDNVVVECPQAAGSP